MSVLEMQALHAIVDMASSLRAIRDHLQRLIIAAGLELESEKRERIKKGKQ